MIGRIGASGDDLPTYYLRVPFRTYTNKSPMFRARDLKFSPKNLFKKRKNMNSAIF